MKTIHHYIKAAVAIEPFKKKKKAHRKDALLNWIIEQIAHTEK